MTPDVEHAMYTLCDGVKLQKSRTGERDQG
jgi:hypothetical protein